MEAILNSFFIVFFGEMGDKTQLLALLLVVKFRKPWTILAGILVATLVNHALAAAVGTWAASLLHPDHLRWFLAALFFGFAFWVLIPDKEEELHQPSRWGAFLATTVAFFIAEMGDKTQLATIALGARYDDLIAVTAGTTAGMMAANVLAVFLGGNLMKWVSMKWLHRIASGLFMLSGIAVLMG